MQRWLIAVCIVGLVVVVAGQRAPAPTPSPPPAGGTPPQDTGTTPPPAPPSGRGGDPNAAIGAPPNTVPPPAPPRLDAPNTGTGTISGVVTDAATGAPLEGAYVSLTGNGTPGQPLVNRPAQVTDSKGRFIFPRLAPSTAYWLVVSRSGYLRNGYRGVPGTAGTEAGIRLADGQWFQEGNVKLWRPSALSGTVRDERGEPLVGAAVRLMVGGVVTGRWRWAAGPVAETDDRGMYRFAGLTRGRYLVQVPSLQISLPSGEAALYRPTSPPGSAANTAGAAAPNQPQNILQVMREPDGSGVVAGLSAAPPPDDKGSVYAAVFHPAARSLDQADPIALEFGRDRIGVDIQMTPVPSVSVSGRVTGPAVAGLPVRIGNPQLGQAGDAGLTKTDATGQFTFHRIPAGDYVIFASRSVFEYRTALQPRLPTGANPFYYSTGTSASNGIQFDTNLTRPGDNRPFDPSEAHVTGRLQVTVGNRPVSGLVVPVIPTVSVSGHLEWDGSETAPATLTRALIRVGLQPADGDITLGESRTSTMAEGAGRRAFTLEDVRPGRHVLANVTASVPDPDSGFPAVTHRLVGATWNGRDILSTPLEVAGDGPVTGIVLRMSSQINKVTGTVRAADGRVATEGAVVVFPPAPGALLESGLSAIRFRMTSVAADGTYEVPPMIPGDYLIAALSTDDQARWLEPDFMALVSGQATRISLGLASALAQDLRVINTTGGAR